MVSRELENRLVWGEKKNPRHLVSEVLRVKTVPLLSEIRHYSRQRKQSNMLLKSGLASLFTKYT